MVGPISFQIHPDSEPYGVRLEVFEGPLDLLLYLIRKNEIDIYDIPVAEITRQYMEYVEVIQELNLEQAGDFLLMAATLMKIKSQMLLPRQEGEEEEGDPREELVRRLLEYQQYKEAAGWLGEQEAACRDIFYRGAFQDPLWGVQRESDGLRQVALFDLMAAFKQALESALRVTYHRIEEVEVSVEERIAFVAETLEKRGQVLFFDLVSGTPRLVIVATFLAILELLKQGRILIRQTQPYEEIWLYWREDQPGPQGTGDQASGDGSPQPPAPRSDEA
jgi:segregation and condensation protein A